MLFFCYFEKLLGLGKYLGFWHVLAAFGVCYLKHLGEKGCRLLLRPLFPVFRSLMVVEASGLEGVSW